VVRVLGRWRFSAYPGQTQDVLWTSPSGSKLIVVAPDISPFGHTHLQDPPWAVGVLTGDQFTPLPQAFMHYTGEIAW